MSSETIIMSLVFVFMALLTVLLILVVWGTIQKNKWGVNLKGAVCPSCGTPQPTIRPPTSIQQAMWGGWTCPKCGQVVDKWGRSATQNS